VGASTQDWEVATDAINHMHTVCETAKALCKASLGIFNGAYTLFKSPRNNKNGYISSITRSTSAAFTTRTCDSLWI